ncbi:hypothetical protein AWU49_0218875 [Acinetobacter baumannii]|uniref:hypothetical protein n=1 Tax=Acinetobacter baumannii TaxID=470 RepID=UPI0002BBE0C4|nr:hypothetical protein [Acinetobacter baumannii]AVO91214.1 hypothetical protein AM480_10340 [Acinetobacter baumannii]EKV2085819.1 hypothetical protein [Acinetobacter baumannii]KWA86317.1 hypothetical protein AWU48_18430 [Acinetobacter baumannii]OLV04796.1 hypothetical protein AWU49_0218875 [Acinetobacter baumannii]
MDNYKIKVNDEAESKEAQELFFELGYSWLCCGKYYNRIGNYTFITAYPDEMLLRMGWGGDTDKELTLPQLRDLVVLKRNDVKDATHEDQYGDKWLYLDERHYVYLNYQWSLPTGEFLERYELKPIEKSQPQDPALISGADAELVAQAKKFITSDHLNRFEAAEAHLEGHPVQFMLANGDFIDITSDTTLGIFEKDGGYSFRLKPQTIKLELELPKPFEPEEDCHVYILDDGKTDGYRRYFYEVHGDKGNEFIGIWRTEEEIKQVVEQIRKIRGTNS